MQVGSRPALERLRLALCWVTGGALTGLMAVTVADILSRKLFSAPVAGALELSEFLMGVSVFAALPLVSLHGEHIAFDALGGLLPPAWRHRQWWLANALAAAMWAVLAALLASKALELRQFGDNSPEYHLPVWLFVALAAGFTALTAAAHGIVIALRREDAAADVL
jgi:TRAP-type C4-dicarboxylate transport system permease small subunit